MREMITKGRHQLAEEYLKKCLLSFSSNFDLLASILTAYAKLIKKTYQGGVKVKLALNFIFDQLKKASIKVSDEFFSSLVLYVQLNLSTADQKAHIIEIQREKLINGDRKHQSSHWLDLIRTLIQFKEHSEAKKQFERGLISISQSEK